MLVAARGGSIALSPLLPPGQARERRKCFTPHISWRGATVVEEKHNFGEEGRMAVFAVCVQTAWMEEMGRRCRQGKQQYSRPVLFFLSLKQFFFCTFCLCKPADNILKRRKGSVYFRNRSEKSVRSAPHQQLNLFGIDSCTGAHRDRIEVYSAGSPFLTHIPLIHQRSREAVCRTQVHRLMAIGTSRAAHHPCKCCLI